MLVLSVRSIGSRCSTKKLAAPFESVLPWAVTIERANWSHGTFFATLSPHEAVERPHRRAPAASATRPATGPTTCRPSNRRTPGCRAVGRPAWRACPGRDPRGRPRPGRPAAACRWRRGRRGGGTRRRRHPATAGSAARRAWRGSSRRSGCSAAPWRRRSDRAWCRYGDGHRDAADPAGEPDRDVRLAPAGDLEPAGVVDRATVSSVLANLAQCVTSSTRPSE